MATKPFGVAFRRFDGVYVIVSRHDSNSLARKHESSKLVTIPLTYHADGRVTYESQIRSNRCELQCR